MSHPLSLELGPGASLRMFTLQHDHARNPKILDLQFMIAVPYDDFQMSCGIENLARPPKKNTQQMQELTPLFLLAGRAGLQQRNSPVQSMVSTTGKCHTCIPKAPAKRKQDSTGMKQHAFNRAHQDGFWYQDGP